MVFVIVGAELCDCSIGTFKQCASFKEEDKDGCLSAQQNTVRSQSSAPALHQDTNALPRTTTQASTTTTTTSTSTLSTAAETFNGLLEALRALFENLTRMMQ